MGWPPADHDAFLFLLGENIPDGLRLPGEIRYRPHHPEMRIRLCKSVYAVLVGPFAGGNARPEHWRQDRIEGGEISHHPTFDQTLEIRQLPRIEQRAGDTPVGGVPADQ